MTKKQAKQCVGKGWSKLIDEFFVRLPKGAKVNYCKEKFGTLRFECTGDTGDLEIEILNKSEHVCEFCGEPGELKNHRNSSLMWYRTLCEKCLKNKENERKI